MPNTPRDPEREQFWRSHIDAWRAGPETVVEYCRKHGLNVHTFRAWQKVLSDRDKERGAKTERARPGRRRVSSVQGTTTERVTFAPVAITDKTTIVNVEPAAVMTSSAQAIEIVTPKGVIVRLPVTIDAGILGLFFRIIVQACSQ